MSDNCQLHGENWRNESSMKITEIKTLRLEEYSNICYVQIYTDEGISGLGETFFGAGSVEAWIHDNAAPILLGKDPLQIEKNWHSLSSFTGGKMCIRDRGCAEPGFPGHCLRVGRRPFPSEPPHHPGGVSGDRHAFYQTCRG